MPQSTRHHHPSLETSESTGGSAGSRASLYDNREAFISRIGPVAVAAIYFGGISLAPKDDSLSRQALFKLSFLHRHFLHPGGVRIAVDKHTAVLSGKLTNRLHYTLAEILARQIEGIQEVKDATELAAAKSAGAESTREAIEFLLVTDQTLRTGVQVLFHEGRLALEGEVRSEAQKSWAEQLAAAVVGSEVDSSLRLSTYAPPPMTPVSEPPQLDDESLQALALFRLRLVRETEHLNLKVKASRGVVTLQGKVRTEALRQRAENIVRSTLGIRELRSSLSVVG
jgi:osmotically-inducible protein OsmY